MGFMVNFIMEVLMEWLEPFIQNQSLQTYTLVLTQFESSLLVFRESYRNVYTWSET